MTGDLIKEAVNTVRNHKNLDVWITGIQLVDLVYDLTQQFPANEKFGLTSQMQRAAVSIPSNIAEGAARQHPKEYIQFCSIALGSCAELETLIVIAHKRKFFNETECLKVSEMLAVEMKMLLGLIRSLKRRYA